MTRLSGPESVRRALELFERGVVTERMLGGSLLTAVDINDMEESLSAMPPDTEAFFKEYIFSFPEDVTHWHGIKFTLDKEKFYFVRQYLRNRDGH